MPIMYIRESQVRDRAVTGRGWDRKGGRRERETRTVSIQCIIAAGVPECIRWRLGLVISRRGEGMFRVDDESARKLRALRRRAYLAELDAQVALKRDESDGETGRTRIDCLKRNTLARWKMAPTSRVARGDAR